MIGAIVVGIRIDIDILDIVATAVGAVALEDGGRYRSDTCIFELCLDLYQIERKSFRQRVLEWVVVFDVHIHVLQVQIDVVVPKRKNEARDDHHHCHEHNGAIGAQE